MFKEIITTLKEDVKQLGRYPKFREKIGKLDYDEYWVERRGSSTNSVLSDWQKVRADQSLKILEAGSSVIDIGCGDGAVLNYFRENKNIKGVGVDVSLQELEKAKNNNIETMYLDLNKEESVSDLPQVDYITIFEVLEHLPDPEEILSKLITKTRKGIIFSVPNTGYYTYRLRLLFGKFPLQWVVFPGEHLRFWTVRDMKYWLEYINVKDYQLFLYKGLPLLNRLFPNLFARGIIVYIKSK